MIMEAQIPLCVTTLRLFFVQNNELQSQPMCDKFSKFVPKLQNLSL